MFKKRKKVKKELDRKYNECKRDMEKTKGELNMIKKEVFNMHFPNGKVFLNDEFHKYDQKVNGSNFLYFKSDYEYPPITLCNLFQVFPQYYYTEVEEEDWSIIKNGNRIVISVNIGYFESYISSKKIVELEFVIKDEVVMSINIKKGE